MMNRNKQLRMWGSCLRGHAQGGLQYGLCDEPDTARYNRMMEIALELLDKTDDIDEEQAEGVARKLMDKTPGPCPKRRLWKRHTTCWARARPSVMSG